jgi:hypothetical protein
VLDQLGLLDDAQRAELSAWREPTIRNYRGIVTGKCRRQSCSNRAAEIRPLKTTFAN